MLAGLETVVGLYAGAVNAESPAASHSDVRRLLDVDDVGCSRRRDSIVVDRITVVESDLSISTNAADVGSKIKRSVSCLHYFSRKLVNRE